VRKLGEAKRRKEQGLVPKKKKGTQSNSLNFFSKYPRLVIYLGASFAIYLIYDFIRFYTR